LLSFAFGSVALPVFFAIVLISPKNITQLYAESWQSTKCLPHKDAEVMEMPGAFIPEQKPALRDSSLQFLTCVEAN
jgi:hypothetical protein